MLYILVKFLDQEM